MSIQCWQREKKEFFDEIDFALGMWKRAIGFWRKIPACIFKLASWKLTPPKAKISQRVASSIRDWRSSEWECSQFLDSRGPNVVGWVARYPIHQTDF